MVEENPKSSFSSHYFSSSIAEGVYSFRVLKMVNSIFIYIGPKQAESFDEIGVAMPLKKNNEIVGTTVLGPLLGCDSQELSIKLAKRLGKQVYISCNAPSDRVRPLLEKCLCEEIKLHPEFF